MSNTLKGDVGSDLFRVAGIYQTSSSEFDKVNIFIPLKKSQELLGIGDKIYEFAMITDNYKNVDKIKNEIASKLNSNYEVQSYKDMLPLLILQMDMYNEMMFIIDFVIGLALIFGIINTMLMAVFERIREIGVLMSIGMKNKKIYLMILMEAFVIGIIGTVVGVIVGLLLYLPLSYSGINFSIFAQSLESFGVGAVIYPVISIQNLINTIIIIPFITVLGALYPAYKAIKLEPVYAINYV